MFPGFTQSCFFDGAPVYKLTAQRLALFYDNCAYYHEERFLSTNIFML